MRETYAKHEENEHFAPHMLTQGSSRLHQACSLLSRALPEHTFGPPGLFQAHLWTARAPPDHKTLVKHACFWPPEHKTPVKHVLLELPDDLAHINYNKTHATYVLFVLSPVLIAGCRWVHRAHFLVRQGQKAIASTLQTAQHT